ncbi:hypothetical protein F5Y18DRAFT_412272 [Xylariaceae sp. FL1019]|nr:hypothetical protein F5Y18DRAFT_412272 [Xylariaceae sp. FL1019]
MADKYSDNRISHQLAVDKASIRQAYLGRDWLGELPLNVTQKALGQFNENHKRALTYLPREGHPPRSFNPHSCTFNIQYGLLCYRPYLREI